MKLKNLNPFRLLKRKKKPLSEKKKRKWTSKVNSVKRHLVKLNERKELMSELKRKLQDKKFFATLESIDCRNPSYVRKYYFKGMRAAIKDTRNNPNEGFDYEKFRKAFLLHQKAVRNKKIKADKYILRSPKVYGRIGQYTIMEYIKKINLETLTFKEITELSKARKELEENLEILAKGKSGEKLQEFHAMCQGKENGKWVISLPYDYR